MLKRKTLIAGLAPAVLLRPHGTVSAIHRLLFERGFMVQTRYLSANGLLYAGEVLARRRQDNVFDELQGAHLGTHRRKVTGSVQARVIETCHELNQAITGFL
jgi:hypothetical protein